MRVCPRVEAGDTSVWTRNAHTHAYGSNTTTHWDELQDSKLFHGEQHVRSVQGDGGAMRRLWAACSTPATRLGQVCRYLAPAAGMSIARSETHLLWSSGPHWPHFLELAGDCGQVFPLLNITLEIYTRLPYCRWRDSQTRPRQCDLNAVAGRSGDRERVMTVS